MIIQLRRLGTVLLVAVMTAAGCGGSSGGDGVSPPPPPPPLGGIIRTGVAVSAGPITGFGSVIVNGVRYETTNDTTFTRDDNPSSQEDFKVGETVIVKGTIDDDNSNAVAETVELDELVKGPVSASAGSELTVMGQTVLVDAGTSIDNVCGISQDNVTPMLDAFAVEVFGLVDSAGVISATRIECKVAADFIDDEFEVNGVVSNHNAGDMTFMINGLQVDYSSAASIDDLPGGQINDGDPVEAKGPPANYDDRSAIPVLTATRVEYKGNRLDGNEGDHFEVDGFISDFVSASEFNLRVGTLVIGVTTTGSTDYEGGSAADLGNNLKVEIEGELNSSDVVLATRIDIKTSTNVRVAGLVDGVAGDVVTILGVAVNTGLTTTRFEDKRDGRDPFRISDIVAGDYVEARGQEQPEGEITAFLVERDQDNGVTELRGFVEDGSVVPFEQFVILGVTVDATSVSSYRDQGEASITADAFWSAVGTGGVLVDVNGTETVDSELQASELQLEME